MLINRRKHIKSKLSVSPHPDRVHFKPRNYAVPKVNNRPAPSSHTCHFSQSSWARATSSTRGGLPNAQRAEGTKALGEPCPKTQQTPCYQQHKNHCANLGTYCCMALYSLSDQLLYSLVLGYRLTPRFSVANVQF